MKTICGVNCINCGWKDICKGCVETNGHPLGGVNVLLLNVIKRVAKTASLHIRID